MTTYMRPVNANLHVHLDNGETFEASADDLSKFGYVRKGDVYTTWETRFREAIGEDVTDSPLNPLRYILEISIYHPDLFKTHADEMQVPLDQIAAIHKFLIEHGYENTYPDEG